MPEPATLGAAATIIAFDFGQRRIGAAVGQSVTRSASPLGIIDNGPGGADHESIRRLIKEWRPDLLVVGMPLHADGSASAVSEAVLEFMRRLECYELPVVTIDERHSSQEAEQRLVAARRAGARGRIQKKDIDAAAAVCIAERYLRHPELGRPADGTAGS